MSMQKPAVLSPAFNEAAVRRTPLHWRRYLHWQATLEVPRASPDLTHRSVCRTLQEQPFYTRYTCLSMAAALEPPTPAPYTETRGIAETSYIFLPIL